LADCCDDRIVTFLRFQGSRTLQDIKVTEKQFVPSHLSLAERMKRRVERRVRPIWWRLASLKVN
jgi:hypothetical protein